MRTLCTLLIAATVACWADAQVAAPPPAERLRLLRLNAVLLEELLAHSVTLSETPNRLDRAAECRKAVATLGGALTTAADERDPDADRVAELAERVAELLETGLTPVLNQSRDQVRNGSPGAEQLAEVERGLAQEVADYQAAVAPTSRVGNRNQVRAAALQLNRAGNAVMPRKE